VSIKRLGLAWLAGTVSFAVLHVLLHGVLLGSFFLQHLGPPKSEPRAVVLAMAVLLYPASMTYLYRLAYRGGNPLVEGLRLGAIVGLLFVLPLNLVHTTYLGASMTLVLVDTPLHVVEQGLMGAIIGWVAGRGAPAAAPS
jgi:hypothetical protein